jgi:hypothetical protein
VCKIELLSDLVKSRYEREIRQMIE